MKNIILSAIITISLAPCLAQNNSGKTGKLLSINELQEDISILESSLKKNHPRLYEYSSKQKLDSAFLEIKSNLKQGSKPIDFYRMLTTILPLIGNNHTNITPPIKFIEFIKTDAKRFPFSLYHINDTLFVSQDASNEYEIKEGSILLSLSLIHISEPTRPY